MTLAELKTTLETQQPHLLLTSELVKGELTAFTEIKDLLEFVRVLRDTNDFLFEQLTDLTVVDYPEREKRFEIVYHFLSFKSGLRIRLKANIAEEETIPSLVGLYPSACWWEREAWDMFGVVFEGTHDHRRLLTDYGFDGHPLRKDFPVTGFVEVRYDEATKKVINMPVELPQAFRHFDFESPWEGVRDLLKKETVIAPEKD